MKNPEELTDWDLIFEYEQAAINYAKVNIKYKPILKDKACVLLECYRREIISRMGW